MKDRNEATPVPGPTIIIGKPEFILNVPFFSQTGITSLSSLTFYSPIQYEQIPYFYLLNFVM
jgi:hypothetical protein